jgi:DNA-binding SARP family transcriptional activator
VYHGASICFDSGRPNNERATVMATALLGHDDGPPQLRLLDGFDLCQNGHSLQLRLGSQRLLAFLALANKKLERAAAAYRLWPDKTERRATANLRSALWRIHQVPIDLVDTTATHIRLRPEVWVDIRDGRTELVRPAGEAIAGGMAAALCGDLLPDWYDDWLLVERERLRQDRLHALETAIDRLLDSGELPTAIDLGLQAIAMEPLRESAHRLVVRAHLLEGNRAEAIRQYETCRRLLFSELGVPPSPQLRALVDDYGATDQR